MDPPSAFSRVPDSGPVEGLRAGKLPETPTSLDDERQQDQEQGQEQEQVSHTDGGGEISPREDDERRVRVGVSASLYRYKPSEISF